MSTTKSPYASDGIATYPNPSIDPREKNYDWILQYVKAAYLDSKGWMPNGSLNVGNLKMAEIKMYNMARQPVDKYKKQFSPGQPVDESWRSIDWTVPAFMCKYREIELSKIHQKDFDLQAYAIDPMAKSEEDQYFTNMKIKIIARESVQKAGGNPDDFSQLRVNPGEPQDLEQLGIQKEFTYKHAMAMQAENAFNLIFQQNNIDEILSRVEQSLYDFGIGAMTQYIDENGMVKVRDVNMEYFGSSYFEKADGSDMIHWFELVPTYIGDLAPYYTKEQLDDICIKACGKNGNPTSYAPFNGFFNRAWNRFKVFVMQIKFLSYNDTVYKEETDSRDNQRFGKSSYQNLQFLVSKNGQLESKDKGTPDENDFFSPLNETGERGQATPKYIKSTTKVSYKASWILGTDYMHDYGLRENQNRKLSSWWDTDLDIQLYAWNFYKMQFTGIAERLIALEDQACMTWFNLQNLANKLVPYLINMEMNSIEGAFPYGKGGTKGKPSDVIDFIFSNFVVPYRASDLQSRNPNFKPVSIEASGQLQAFGMLYDKLERTLEYMRQVSGLNEATDASTINAKNLNSTNEAMVESTNNAIYPIVNAKKNILLRTADAIIQKIQIAVQLGKIEGYAKALGTNAVDFFRIDPDISLHELGIFIDDAPTKAQREALWQDANIKESQGLLTIGDKAFLMTVRNLKEAYALLDYKIQKRKEEQQQFALQQTQATAQANGQVAQMTEQMKQQTIGVQLKADLVRIQTQMEWEYRIEGMKKSADVSGEQLQADARTIGHQIQAGAKIEAAKVAAGSSVASKHIQGQYDVAMTDMDNEATIEKQKIANKKPKSTTKK